jgi:hypothetical protein
MNGYISAPSFFVSTSNDDWAVDRPGLYQYYDQVLEMPTGFITNFASIPKALRWLIPVNGKHRLAAVLHDYMYSMKIDDRDSCDLAFLEEMERQNVRYTKRQAMFMIVQWVGKKHYGT